MALVVTIVVLLILAAISINLVLGQNGLITYAKKASKETKESALKEEVDLALANYELEKIKNKDTTLKEYMENTEKSGLENFKLIDENPSEDVQFIGSIDGRLLIMKTDGSYVLTKSGNLVRNGFGDNGNDNFPDFTNNNGTFSITTSQRNGFFCSELIPVDNTKKYYESMLIKASDKNNIMYIGMAEYDIDREVIQSTNYLYNPNSLTYLEKDLNNGDTEIYLHDISGFTKENLNIGHNDGLIFWNYKDSTGYKYPELTYSRNLSWSSFSGRDNFDNENNKIILNKPWEYGKIEKGTKVSQKADGPTYDYGLIGDKNVEETYKLYNCEISGIKESGKIDYYKFCSATKYVKIWLGINYSDVQNLTTEIKNIIFAEYE